MEKKLLIIFVILSGLYNSFAQVPTDSLVAYYRFNGNANDSSGRGFHGTLFGPISVPGKCGQAYEFHNNYIDCGDPAGLEFDLVNDASICLWVKLLSNIPSGNYSTLIGKDPGPGEYKKWFFSIGLTQLIFHINVPPFSGGVWAFQDVPSFSLNTFYHIAVTKTGNTYSFYINGVFYGSKSMGLNIPYVTANLKIGDLQDGSVPLNAAIDEVLIYRRALTATEINQAYMVCSGVITADGPSIQNQPDDLKIFPNPGSGKFVLSFTDPGTSLKNLSVYDVWGKKISVRQTQLNSQQITVDLENQPSGVYLLQVQTRKKIILRKIIIQ